MKFFAINTRITLTIALTCALTCIASSAWATNGMNLGAYGPIAGGMGGASMAYNNGLAATMNNPATLGLMDQGGRFELGGALLGPSLSAETAGGSVSKSTSTSFFMPGLGGTQKNGNLTYGFAFFSQGGMGAEYAANSSAGTSALDWGGSGEAVKSKLGVMRFMVPLAYNITPDLAVGVTADYVRGGLDLKMAVNPGQFGDLYSTGYQQMGVATGNLISNNLALFGGHTYSRFDFASSSAFAQEASGGGFAGKLGAVYRITPQFSIGAAYHMKTAMSDFTSGNAKMTVKSGGNVYTMTGKVTVQDFQMPAVMGFGVALKPVEKLMVVADYKYIGWSQTMKHFKLNFVTDGNTTNGVPIAAGQTLDVTLYQNWSDQNVLQFGAAYQLFDSLTVRAGANLANNPIPDKYLNPLFAAIVTNEYDLGLGYAITKTSNVDFCFNYAPEVSVYTPTIASNSIVPPYPTVNVNTKLSGYAMQLGYGMSF